MRYSGLSTLTLLLTLAAAAETPESLDAKYRRAQDHLAAGHFADAVPLFAEIVKAMPGNARLLMGLGVAEHMSGDSRGAVRDLKAAAKLDPNLFPAQQYLGLAEMDLGRPDLAIEPLQKAIELDPAQTAARQVLGHALYATGRYEEAADHLRKVTEASPANANAWYTLGRSWLALAGRTHRQVLDLAPAGSSYALAVNADGLGHRQQYRQAFALWREALSKDPNLVSAHAAIADIYRNLGHQDWAAREAAVVSSVDCSAHTFECDFAAERFDAMLAATADKRSAAALYWRGEAYAGLAYGAFDRLEHLPLSPELHRLRASLNYEAGRRAQVVEELKAAVELAPDDVELRRDLAMALGAAHEYEAAYQLALELLRATPEAPDLNALAGDALLNSQKAAEAIVYFKKSLVGDAKNLTTHESLGRAYMQTGAPALALPHLEAAASLDGDGSLHYQLALAYRHTGRADAAKREMEQYRELSSKAAAPSSTPEVTPP